VFKEVLNMRNKWAVRDFNVADKVESDVVLHENEVLDQIFKQRGVKSPSELSYSVSNMLDPFTMKGMDAAVELLIKHIKNDSNMIIIGDFDCDGATATTIGVSGLKLLGAKNISYLIPDRKEHGYGLTEKIVQVAGKAKPDLIITVDNGITSIDGVNAVHALEHPCEILITDHHLPAGDNIPDAEAVVNPSQPGCNFESKALAGCGVMFYVIVALRQRMREKGIFEELGMKEPQLAPLFDVLAVGSVADLVPLDYNNRILVKAGMDRINRGLARPGVTELFKATDVKIGEVTTQSIGFKFAPCINATGRISDGSLAVRCLTSNPDDAREMAEHLVDLNTQRRSIQADMTEDAMAYIENADIGDDFALTLFLEDAEEGVLGIVAGRIKEMSNRPVVCLGPTHSDENIIKGSARSRAPVNVRHVFDKIASIDPDIFVGYGGHAMAAGLSIYKSKLDSFRTLFDKVVREELTEEMIKGDINVDMMLPAEYLTMEMAELIEENGPWGVKFEEPVFGGKYIVRDYRVLKDVHLKMTLEEPETGARVNAISFFSVEDNEVPVMKGNTVDVAFKLSINEYMGRRSLQLMVDNFQDVELCLMKERGEEPVIEEKNVEKVNYSSNKMRASSFSIS